MDFCDYGFPKPAEFEDGACRRLDAQVTAGRVVALGGTVMLGVLLAAAVQYGPELSRQLNRLLVAHRPVVAPRPHDDSRRVILERYQRYWQRGELAQALGEANRLADQHPEIGHVLRGNVLGRCQQYQKAIEAYTSAIEMAGPLQALAYNNRAYHRALARVELHAALADAQRALDFEPYQAAYLDTRGYVNYLLGRPKAALADFDSILDHQYRSVQRDLTAQSLGEMYFHRGLVYKQLGKLDLAEQDFEAAKLHGYKLTEFPSPVIDAAEPEPGDQR